jgi:hypothetical protein
LIEIYSQAFFILLLLGEFHTNRECDDGHLQKERSNFMNLHPEEE